MAKRKGDHERALAYLRQAQRQWPENLRIPLDEAMLRIHMGQLDEADAVIRQVERRPNSPYFSAEASIKRVQLLRVQRKPRRAIAHAAAALSAVRNLEQRGRLHIEIGFAHFAENEFADAIRCFDKANLDVWHPDVRFHMVRYRALARLRVGDIEGAMLDAGNAYVDAPHDNYLGVVEAALVKRCGYTKGRDILFEKLRDRLGGANEWRRLLVVYHAVMRDKPKLMKAMIDLLENDDDEATLRFLRHDHALLSFADDAEIASLLKTL